MKRPSEQQGKGLAYCASSDPILGKFVTEDLTETPKILLLRIVFMSDFSLPGSAMV